VWLLPVCEHHLDALKGRRAEFERLCRYRSTGWDIVEYLRRDFEQCLSTGDDALSVIQPPLLKLRRRLRGALFCGRLARDVIVESGCSVRKSGVGRRKGRSNRGNRRRRRDHDRNRKSFSCESIG
jgi:hypothetical protein